MICSRDRAALLEGALEAIESAKRPGDETVLVDSASRDGAVRAVGGRFPGVTVVRSEQPGLARARNIGVRASSGAFIAFTDDDCRPEVGWAARVADLFDAEPKLGFVTGRVMPDRSEGPMLSVLGHEDAREFRYGTDPAEFGHGANFAVRREALESVGLFDEALGVGMRFAGAEDHDALWRILRAGWLGRYDPGVSVVHCQWRTRRQHLRSEYGYGLGSGAFAMKAMRMEPETGRALLKDRLWNRGLRSAMRALREGNESGAIGDTLRFAGCVVGAVSARRLRVSDGRFVG